jgi:hypothetical protein
MGTKQMIAKRRGKLISEANQRKIRDALNASDLKDAKGNKITFRDYKNVIKAAVEQGAIDNNLPLDVKKRRAYDYFADIYNQCEENQDKNKEYKELQAQLKKRKDLSKAQREKRNKQTEAKMADILTKCFRKQQKEKERQRENDALLTINDVAKRIKDGQTQEVTLNNNKEAKRFFNKMKGVRFNVAIEFGNQWVSLNNANIDKYLRQINKDQFFAGDDLSNYAAFSNYARGQDKFTVHPNMSIEQFNKIYGHQCFQKNEGGFFPYKHRMDGIDLSPYQIWHTNDSLDKNTEHCFIQALRAGGVEESKIENIKGFLTGHCLYLPLPKLKTIAEKFELYLTVRQLPKKGQDAEASRAKQNSTRCYPTHKNEKNHLRVDMGLVENHYFHIGKVPITQFAMAHYDELKHMPRWNEVIENTKMLRSGKPAYEKNRKCFTDSWTLIRKMVTENKHLLREIPREELFDTHFHNISDTLRDLSISDSNFKLNKYDEKQDDEDTVNVFFDFETITDCVKHHVPYLCRASCFKERVFLGEDCGRKLLYALVDRYEGKNLRLIAHNASYDWHFIHQYLCRLNTVEKGTRMVCATGYFYKAKGVGVKVDVHCSWAKMSPDMSLKKFPKTFNIHGIEKEVMPYGLYTSENVKRRYIPYNECINAVKIQFGNENIGRDETTKSYQSEEDDFVARFLKNIDQWDCMNTFGDIDIIKYSSQYCRIDCEVLEKGYNTYKGWIKEVTGLNIDNYVTLPSIADAYLRKEKVYQDTYQCGGVVREFISQSMIGGRTMTQNNQMYHIKDDVSAIDAKSLYPSAMIRMGGTLKGKPKMLKELNYEFLKKQDGYFVEIEITHVGREYTMPQMSYIDDKSGVRHWTNKMVGKKTVVSKYQLESFIEFHKIQFNIIRGYYFDEGRNMKLGKVMEHLYHTRQKEKAKGSPINVVYKLLANSAYGKSLMKALEHNEHYIETWDKNTQQHSDMAVDRFKMRNYNHITTWGVKKISDTLYKAKTYKSLNEHFNNCPFGCEVLGMSKIIMSEVMCLAEDLGIEIYITDTDSFHIPTSRLPDLEKAFRQKYGRVVGDYGRKLIGENPGEFHSDFESDIIVGDIVAKEGFYLGKKCYLEIMTGKDKYGNTVDDYHVRMKGVSNHAIKHYAKEHGITIRDIYLKLFQGETLKFDLTCGFQKPTFQYLDDMTVKSRDKFAREIKFRNPTLLTAFC